MKKFPFLTVCLFLSFTLLSQSSFQKYIGTGGFEVGNGIAETVSGYIIGGSSTSFASGEVDVYVIGTNKSGDTLWTKFYGGINNDYAQAISRASNNNGALIIGFSNSFGNGQQIYALRIDSLGNALWSKNIGGSGTEIGCSVANTLDGGWIISGSTDSYGSGGTDAYLIKMDDLGNVSWAKTFGSSNEESAYSVIQCSDGGYIAVGESSFAGSSYDNYIIKTDASGTLQWTKIIGGTYDEGALGIVEISGLGYTFYGSTKTGGAGGKDAFITSIDLSGNLQWSKTYGTSLTQIPRSFALSTDGYALIGSTEVTGSSYNDIYFIKTDLNGSVESSKTIGGPFSDEGSSILTCSDHGFFITGSTENYSALNNDVYLIKMDSNGVSGCNESNFSILSSNAAFSDVPHITLVDTGISIFNSPLLALHSGGTPKLVCQNGITVNHCEGFFCDATSTNPSVHGACDGTATAVGSGVLGPFTYNWYGLTSSGNQATNICAGTYWVIATSSNGCQADDLFTITDPPSTPCDSFAFSITSTNATSVDSCNGSAAISYVHGNYPVSYSWIGLGGNNISQSNICYGNYSAIVIDATGCSDTTQFQINYPGALNATLSSSAPASSFAICDGSAQISVFGGVAPYSFYWVPGGFLTSSSSQLCEGVHNVFVTDANGAKDTVSLNITGPPNPCSSVMIANISVTDASGPWNCDGSAIMGAITGGIAPYHWYWEPDANCANGSPHTVTIVDSAGCTTNFKYEINYPGSCNYKVGNLTTTNISAAGTCDGTATLSMTGGVAPFTYSWSDGYGNVLADTGSNISGLCSDLYTGVITDNEGCTKVLREVVGCSGFTINAGSTNTSWWMNCNGSASVTSINGGTPPYSYFWSPGISSQALINWCPGTYTITVTDSSGCKAAATTTISDPPPNYCDQFNTPGGAFPFYPSDQYACDGSLVGIAVNGTPPYSYQWLPMNTFGSSINNICQGTYSVIITDSRGCRLEPVQINLGVSVYAEAAPESPDSTTRSCTGSARVSASFGTPPYNYLWDNGGTGTLGTELCAGLHECYATDSHTPNPGHDTSLVVIATVPNTFYNNQSVSAYTVFNPPVEDCLLPYGNILNIFISGYHIIDISTVDITWTILDSLFSGTTLTKTYHCNTSDMSNMEFILSLYCSSGSYYVNAYDGINLTTGIHSIQSGYDLNLNVYPNPFENELTLSGKIKGGTMKILNILGKEIYSSVLHENTVSLSTDELKAGIYFITVTSENKTSYRKIIKQ